MSSHWVRSFWYKSLRAGNFVNISRRFTRKIARFEKLRPGDIAISVVTYGELSYGAAKSAEPERAAAGLRRLAELVTVVPLPEAAGEAYGAIRAALSAGGHLIGPNDLWIAAHAVAAGLTLATNNEREFKRVKGLKIENWVKG